MAAARSTGTAPQPLPPQFQGMTPEQQQALHDHIQSQLTTAPVAGTAVRSPLPQQPGGSQSGPRTPLAFSPEVLLRLMPLITLQVLQHDQNLRVLTAGALTTMIFPKNHKYAVQLDTTLKAYSNDVRRLGRTHNRGSPAAQLLITTCTFLAGDERVLEHSEIDTFLRDELPRGPGTVGQHVPSFRIHKMYDTTKIRISYQLHSDMEEEVTRGLVAIGGDQRFGQAPQSSLVRQIQEIVDAARPV